MQQTTPSQFYPTQVDLTNCDREPIHIIGKIQNHGHLIACDVQTKIITYCSENAEALFQSSIKNILGNSIDNYLESDIINKLYSEIQNKKVAYKEIKINNSNFTLIIHQSGNNFILEFEKNVIELDPFEYQLQFSEIVSEITTAKDLQEKCNRAAALIKSYLEYDRVMIYQFDAEWNGRVIAEEKEEHMTSWLGLNYPASDIPQQARELFLKQGVRIISDVHSIPERIVYEEGNSGINELDLSMSELRAVSPIHIEYLVNMGVGASMTAAIVNNGVLWGLIACHHTTPKYINYYQRLSCKFLTLLFANDLQLNSTNSIVNLIKESAFIRSKLLSQIRKEDEISHSLSSFKYTLNDLTNSTGAAIYIKGEITSMGECPDDHSIINLIKQINKLTEEDVFHSNHIMALHPEAVNYRTIASGVLCLFLSKADNDALIWFKPEVLQTVTWAGNPEKKVTINKDERISPRKSFEKWSVKQEGKSEPWLDHEVSGAMSLQKSVLDIAIEKKYEEVIELNDKLVVAYDELESFSYSISHDLRAPLRGIDGFAHIIKEDYYESLDEFGKSSIKTIISSVDKMNMLIDDILEYSGLGRKNIEFNSISLNELVNEVLPDLKITYPNVNVSIDENIPMLYGDKATMLLLIKNLVENAMKYSSKTEEPLVQIGFAGDNTFYVKDNGIGMEMKHKTLIFGVFNRLVNDSEYEGSGIGLAIAKRVVDKHNGTIWVKSKLKEGATFYFKLGNEEK